MNKKKNIRNLDWLH